MLNAKLRLRTGFTWPVVPHIRSSLLRPWCDLGGKKVDLPPLDPIRSATYLGHFSRTIFLLTAATTRRTALHAGIDRPANRLEGNFVQLAQHA